MQLIQAIAKSVPRQVNTKYGQRTVIDATGQNGEEITIWRGGDDHSPALNSITNGSRIAVAVDSRGKYSLVETPADRAAQVASKPASPIVSPTEARPMGFQIEAPFEAERRLRAQMAAAKSQQGASIKHHQPKPSPIDARIAELAAIYGKCLAVAHGSEFVAIEIFKLVA
jgi:hypothetical protein